MINFSKWLSLNENLFDGEYYDQEVVDRVLELYRNVTYDFKEIAATVSKEHGVEVTPRGVDDMIGNEERSSYHKKSVNQGNPKVYAFLHILEDLAWEGLSKEEIFAWVNQRTKIEPNFLEYLYGIMEKEFNQARSRKPKPKFTPTAQDDPKDEKDYPEMPTLNLNKGTGGGYRIMRSSRTV